MIRQTMMAGVAALLVMMMGCGSKDNPVAPVAGDTPVPGPASGTVVFSEGFGGTLSSWAQQYMINVGDYYPRMTITTAVAHSGTHSITSDTSQSALEYDIANRIETGVAGIQFYIMATGKGQANFSVQFGQNAGSSGGLGKAFGIGFNKSDSITCVYYDYMDMNQYLDSAIAPMQLNHWYKCAVEVNFGATQGTGTITWKLDDVVVRTSPLPTQDMNGIDRTLVFRGVNPNDLAMHTDHLSGPKPYYADDIVLYTR
jgi:hypothetical protein